jgi:P2 family phage contractile tail tube protein
MSAASNILKQFNLFVDGVGFAGEIEELQTPKLALVEDDYRAGGMDAPVGIDMGMEKLEATFTLSGSSASALGLFGLASGAQTQLTARGSLESYDGTKTPVVVAMRGKIKSLEPGAWKGGEKAAWAFGVSLNYYRYEQGGQVIHEIDVINMIRVINGVDQLAEHRANIGL